MNSPAKRSARIGCSPPPDDRINFPMDMQSAGVTSTRAFRLGDFLRDQLRNIAPFITLIAIIAFGLTFVILTAEIDLSVGAVAGATAIVLTYFTAQPDYVNIANLPMPGWVAIIFALIACCALGLITAFGVT